MVGSDSTRKKQIQESSSMFSVRTLSEYHVLFHHTKTPVFLFDLSHLR